MIGGTFLLSTIYTILTLKNQSLNSVFVNQISSQIFVEDSELAKKNGSFIYFVFFNRFMGHDKKWGLGKETSTPEDLMSVNCSHTNCIFTSKSDLLPNVHDFDVVFVNAWWQNDLELPKTRHSRQTYVFGLNEYNIINRT